MDVQAVRGAMAGVVPDLRGDLAAWYVGARPVDEACQQVELFAAELHRLPVEGRGSSRSVDQEPGGRLTRGSAFGGNSHRTLPLSSISWCELLLGSVGAVPEMSRVAQMMRR